jgi:hypothetical protein
MDQMETLREAIARLERVGYRAIFRARHGGFVDLTSGRLHAPESLTVDEIVRFEGESDPGDEAVLFALRARDGSRGTFVATFGPYADPLGGELVRRLSPVHPPGAAAVRFSSTQ